MPPQAPRDRYHDAVRYFEGAVINGARGGLIIPTAGRSQSIALAHRLNRARRAIREFEGSTIFDDYIVRAEANHVSIELRMLVDLSMCRALDGTPAIVPPTAEEIAVADRERFAQYEADYLANKSKKLSPTPTPLEITDDE